jgi:phosphoadenosine phosphosulfate reductase
MSQTPALAPSGNQSHWTETQVQALNQELEFLSVEERLSWASSHFGDRLHFACSLGLEDAALLDLISRVAPSTRVFVLDTGRLNPETYDTLARLQARYAIDIELYFPEASAVEAWVQQNGINGFYESLEQRKTCCHVRKVEPLGRALKDASAWITGLRREQAVTRVALNVIEVDQPHGGILKINPLSHWTLDQVWDHIHRFDVPYNPLHDKGFPSIGCAPCTRAIEPGEDIRAGRWWWESSEHKECGLHKRKTP